MKIILRNLEDGGFAIFGTFRPNRKSRLNRPQSRRNPYQSTRRGGGGAVSLKHAQ